MQMQRKYHQRFNSDLAWKMHHIYKIKLANNYNDQQFSIPSRARSTFKLSTLKNTYIETIKFFTCRQNELVYSSQISHYTVVVSDIFPMLHLFVFASPHQPINALPFNQSASSVSMSLSFIKTTTFVLSSHSNMILDNC